MALYTNIAGFNVGSWLTDQLDSGGSTTNTIRLDPTTGDIVMFDPGVVLPTSPSDPLPVDQGTIIKYGDAPINTPTIDYATALPTPVAPVPLPPAPTPTTTTPAATTTTKKNYFPLVLLGGLILMAASNDDFIPKGKRLFFLGGVGLLYYLANKDKIAAA